MDARSIAFNPINFIKNDNDFLEKVDVLNKKSGEFQRAMNKALAPKEDKQAAVGFAKDKAMMKSFGDVKNVVPMIVPGLIVTVAAPYVIQFIESFQQRAEEQKEHIQKLESYKWRSI